MAKARRRKKAPGALAPGLSVTFREGEYSTPDLAHLVFKARVSRARYGASKDDSASARRKAFGKAQKIFRSLGGVVKDTIGTGGVDNYTRLRFWGMASGPTYTIDESENRIFSERQHIGARSSRHLSEAVRDMTSKLDGFGDGLTLSSLDPTAPPKPEAVYGKARFLTPPEYLEINVMIDRGLLSKTSKRKPTRKTSKRKPARKTSKRKPARKTSKRKTSKPARKTSKRKPIRKTSKTKRTRR